MQHHLFYLNTWIITWPLWVGSWESLHQQETITYSTMTQGDKSSKEKVLMCYYGCIHSSVGYLVWEEESMCPFKHLEVREQLGESSLLPPCGLQDHTQALRSLDLTVVPSLRQLTDTLIMTDSYIDLQTLSHSLSNLKIFYLQGNPKK